MLSADPGDHVAMPGPQPRTWDDKDQFPVLSNRGSVTTGYRVQKHGWGLVFGFPVELLGASEPDAAFLNESRTRWCRQRPVTGNPNRPSLSSHVRHSGAGVSPACRQRELPDGMGQPPLVRGGIQHVDTPGVHMLGHLENSIELVIQGRFASRPRQRVVTRS